MPENPNDHPADPGVMYRLIHMNPALWRGLVLATFLLLGTLGVKFIPNLPDALIGWLAVVLAIVQGVWTRDAVTANEKVLAYLPNPIDKPNVVAAGEALTTAPDLDVRAAVETPAPTDGSTILFGGR